MENNAEDLVKLIGCVYVSMASALGEERRKVANRTMRDLADDLLFPPHICRTLAFFADTARVATPKEIEEMRNEVERARRDQLAAERRQNFTTVLGGNTAA